MRVTWFVAGLALWAASDAGAFRFTGQSDDEIYREAGAAYAAKAAELLPSCGERTETLEAVLRMLDVRGAIVDSLRSVRNLKQMDGIWMADVIDDSLAYYLHDPLNAYTERHPTPSINPGAERFESEIGLLGFVGDWATGFLVHLELQQSLALLAEFRQARSESEIEGAEDALLRHFDELVKLYRAQHANPRDRHYASLANLEWAIGRIESEGGTKDFTIANQYFADRGEKGFAYMLELFSATTGERMEVFYPLPHLTSMDEGVQERRRTDRRPQ
jgi:hypothetical protein